MWMAWNGPDEFYRSLRDYYARYYVPYSSRTDEPWPDPVSSRPYVYRRRLVPDNWSDLTYQYAAAAGFTIRPGQGQYLFQLCKGQRIIIQSRSLYSLYLYLRPRDG